MLKANPMWLPAGLVFISPFALRASLRGRKLSDSLNLSRLVVNFQDTMMELRQVADGTVRTDGRRSLEHREEG